jgi:hypothetical protein
MKLGTIAAYLFCLAAGLFLASFELHTDDTGVEVLFILLFTFVLGCWQPRHAWQWALLVGPWAPAADLWQLNFGITKPALEHTGGLLLVTGVVIALGLAGSYAGALLRKGVQLAARQP